MVRPSGAIRGWASAVGKVGSPSGKSERMSNGDGSLSSVAPWAHGGASMGSREGTAHNAGYVAAARDFKGKVKLFWKTAVSIVATRYADDVEAKRILSQLLDVPNASEEVLRIILAADRGPRTSSETSAGIRGADAGSPMPTLASDGTEDEAAGVSLSQSESDLGRSDCETGVEESHQAAPRRDTDESRTNSASGGFEVHKDNARRVTSSIISSLGVETAAGAAEFGPDGLLLADSTSFSDR